MRVAVNVGAKDVTSERCPLANPPTGNYRSQFQHEQELIFGPLQRWLRNVCGVCICAFSSALWAGGYNERLSVVLYRPRSDVHLFSHLTRSEGNGYVLRQFKL